MDGKDISQLPFVRQYNGTKQVPNVITAQWLQQTADPFGTGFKPNPLSETLYGKKPAKPTFGLNEQILKPTFNIAENEEAGPSSAVEEMSARLSLFSNPETLPSIN